MLASSVAWTWAATSSERATWCGSKAWHKGCEGWASHHAEGVLYVRAFQRMQPREVSSATKRLPASEYERGQRGQGRYSTRMSQAAAIAGGGLAEHVTLSLAFVFHEQLSDAGLEMP